MGGEGRGTKKRKKRSQRNSEGLILASIQTDVACHSVVKQAADCSKQQQFRGTAADLESGRCLIEIPFFSLFCTWVFFFPGIILHYVSVFNYFLFFFWYFLNIYFSAGTTNPEQNGKALGTLPNITKAFRAALGSFSVCFFVLSPIGEHM